VLAVRPLSIRRGTVPENWVSCEKAVRQHVVRFDGGSVRLGSVVGAWRRGVSLEIGC